MSPYARAVSSVLFPLHERLKGHDTVRLRRELEQSQWWSRERLEQLQLTRLRGLLTEVAATVPFYRELFRERGLTPEQFQSLAALTRLPVIDKRMIRERREAWQAEGARNLQAQQTSGSSGEPLHFSLGKRRVSFDIAAKWRATRWWGVDVGDRELVIWGSAIETGAQSRIKALRDRLFRSTLAPAQDLDPERLDAILETIHQKRPRMLFGYPSVFARLAWRARERGVAVDKLGIRVVFATAEVLRPEWRAVIAETFGCAVANEYGARDAGFIARECPEGGLHITAEEVILEVVDDDGAPVPAGQPGELVVTNLVGPEFPFIRYRTGDRGIIDPAPCPCGRGLPVLREVIGRSNDGLVALNGAWVHGSAFNYLLRELDGLQAYKIVQETRRRVRVFLVVDGQVPEPFAQRLIALFRERLGDDIDVELQRVDAIAPEANGKFRHVVCRVEEAA